MSVITLMIGLTKWLNDWYQFYLSPDSFKYYFSPCACPSFTWPFVASVNEPHKHSRILVTTYNSEAIRKNYLLALKHTTCHINNRNKSVVALLVFLLMAFSENLLPKITIHLVVNTHMGSWQPEVWRVTGMSVKRIYPR